jgi:hypothetical protein
MAILPQCGNSMEPTLSKRLNGVNLHGMHNITVIISELNKQFVTLHAE